LTSAAFKLSPISPVVEFRGSKAAADLGHAPYLHTRKTPANDRRERQPAWESRGHAGKVKRDFQRYQTIGRRPVQRLTQINHAAPIFASCDCRIFGGQILKNRKEAKASASKIVSELASAVSFIEAWKQ